MKPRSSGPTKAKRRTTGPSKATRDLVAQRSGGYCERCPNRAEHIHHRKPRAMGGTRVEAINLPSNLVHVCAQCHREIESDRRTAYFYGWLVPRPHDPATWPVRLLGGRWVLLTNEGGVDDAVPDGQEGVCEQGLREPGPGSTETGEGPVAPADGPIPVPVLSVLASHEPPVPGSAVTS